MKLNTITKFILAAQHPSKGRFIISGMYIQYGIVGAALLEMSKDKQIDIENNKVLLIQEEKSYNPIISEISMQIGNSKKIRTIKYWITKLAQKSNRFKWAILTDLEKNNLIKIERKSFLGIIPYRRHFLIDNTIRDNLISQLRNNVLFRQNLDEESILMLGLVEACKMHKIIALDRQELKKVKKELKQIIKESPIAETLDKTIKQIQAAIMGAIIASTVAASASGSN